MSDENGSQQDVDVVVVGGGAAGLASAVALARSLRSVVVVDAGEPRNAPADGVHNLLGREGVRPTELVADGRRELEGYGGQVRRGRVASAVRDADGRFTVALDDGAVLRARRVVLATGLVDDLPDVPGLAERWGHDVLHCPFCHGWEARGRRIGVLVTSPGSWHQAGMWRQLSDDVTVLLHTGPAPDAATRAGLAARGVPMVEGEVDRVRVDDALRGVTLADGTEVDLEVLVVAPVFRARSELAEAFGLDVEDVEMDGHLMATKVPSAPDGSTAVPGLWVAGNLVDPMAQVAGATASGLMAGARVNGDLVAEDLRLAAAG